MKLTPTILLRGLQRNFGGIEHSQFNRLAETFFLELGWKLPTTEDETIERLKESLAERLDPTSNPNTAAFRYIMIVDPTENESSLALLKVDPFLLPLLFLFCISFFFLCFLSFIHSSSKLYAYLYNYLKELGLCKSIVRVGDFPQDNTSESLANVVRSVRTEMAQGSSLILVNSSIIDGCFYDVFNRYFTVTTTPEGKKQFVANVAIGSHSKACPIHSDFQIMVHVPLSRMKSTPLPFLNRFEKYILSINQVVDVSTFNIFDFFIYLYLYLYLLFICFFCFISNSM